MQEMICRLCLQIIDDNNCYPVEESLLMSLKLNIKISKENVMCIECSNCLRAFSNFTPGCVYTEDEMLRDSKNGVKLEPESIETTTNLKSLMETKIKCSFCTKTGGREDLISLQISNENKSLLEQYIPETHLKNTEELLTCETCLGLLEGALSVILKCLEVEEKISKYVELKGMDDKGQVELKEVQQFTFRPILKSEVESLGINELEDRSDQVQEECTMMDKAEIKYENEIRNTELIIKLEGDEIIKSEGYDVKIEQDHCDTTDIKPQQRDYVGFQEPLIENKNPSEIKMFQCEFCTYQAKWKSHLERHLLTHKNRSKSKMFKCDFCLYQAKWKNDLARHLLTHKEPYQKTVKCEICPYETNRKYYLKHHLLTHRSPSEIDKNPQEIEWFQCATCSLKTKSKSNLRYHLLTHKSPSEIKMFKCESCSLQTKWKSVLTSHLLTHKNPQEIKIFKCEICSYKARRKTDLKRHLLTHQSPSEIKIFKCKFCKFQAKWKSHLKRHLLGHKRKLNTLGIFIQHSRSRH